MTHFVAHDPVGGAVAQGLVTLSLWFNHLVGAERVTPTVGLLAVLLALVLGASHAALPGHGKTVIAAYIVGRRGSLRDALTVGTTVTVTHTAGVIALGLLLSGLATLGEDKLLAYLAAASGLLVAGIGVGMLVDAPAAATRRRRVSTVPHQYVESPECHADVAERLEPVPYSHGRESAAATGHGHGHPDEDQGGHRHRHRVEVPAGTGPIGRVGLIGMGIAGGLVPSPSALVVLLGAISLGRTVFGVLLVLCYGIGMAATLTAAGLLLVAARNRFDVDLRTRFGARGLRVASLAPVMTALLVLAVGLGMTARGLYPLLTP